MEPTSSGAIVRRVVLTGGPCAGKTTVQTMVADAFQERGWKVYRVPETATVLLSGGVVFSQLNEEQGDSFQENLLKTMLAIEKTYFELAELDAKQGRRVLVLCDRGAMDPSAYLPRDRWLKQLERNGLNEIALRDQRYDCIVHMVTAAKGATQFYQLANNNTGTGVFMADLTANAWVGHPYFYIIDNSTDFETKLARVVNLLLTQYDEQQVDMTRYIKRKLLLKRSPTEEELADLRTEQFDVQHAYIISNDTRELRIRSRGWNGSYSYTYTTRRTDQKGQVYEVKHIISASDFETLLGQRDPARHIVCMTRRCFRWHSTYVHLNTYVSPHPGLCFLEVYTDPQVELVKSSVLPGFLEIEREVTGEATFSMRELSAA